MVRLKSQGLSHQRMVRGRDRRTPHRLYRHDERPVPQEPRRKDLAGQSGRVRAGKSGGGNCYGYDVIRGSNNASEPERGGRCINEKEAAIVSYVFNEYAAGRSPKAIAHALNRRKVPGPVGKAWGPCTINGNWRRGTGILNNELYVGRLVCWKRCSPAPRKSRSCFIRTWGRNTASRWQTLLKC
jgi:hypothetical protein